MYFHINSLFRSPFQVPTRAGPRRGGLRGPRLGRPRRAALGAVPTKSRLLQQLDLFTCEEAAECPTANRLFETLPFDSFLRSLENSDGGTAAYVGSATSSGATSTAGSGARARFSAAK